MKDSKHIKTPNSIIEFELLTNNDEYIEVSSFLKKWNEINPYFKKRIDRFFKNKRTKIFIDDLKHLNPNKQVFYLKKGVNTKYGRTPNIYFFCKSLFLEFKLWLHPRLSIRTLNYICQILDGKEIRKEKYIIDIPILTDNDKVIFCNGKVKHSDEVKKYTVIHQYSIKNGKLVGIYNSIDNAVKKTKIPYNVINNALNGRYNKSSYVWKYC